MKDIPITIGAIVLTVIVVIVVPVITMADRFDTTTQTEVDAILSDFVEEVRTTGKLTQEKYSQLTTNLDSLGYTFDVEMEIKALDEKEEIESNQNGSESQTPPLQILHIPTETTSFPQTNPQNSFWCNNSSYISFSEPSSDASP